MLHEISVTLLGVVALLCAIFLIKLFVDYLDKAAAAIVPISSVIDLVLLNLATALPRLIPLALMLAVVIALTRLVRDNEIIALMSMGIGRAQQIRAVLLYAACFAILVFYLSFFLTPIAYEKREGLKAEVMNEAHFSAPIPRRFNSFNNGKNALYIERLNADQQAEQVFLHLERPTGMKTILAKRGYVSNTDKRQLILEDGVIYLGIPGERDYQVITFKRYTTVLFPKKQPTGKALLLSATPTMTLLNFKHAHAATELQWRLSHVLSTLLLPLLAHILILVGSARYRPLIILITILLTLLYSNLLGLSRSLMLQGKIDALPGLWWVHLVFLLLCFVLLRVKKFPQ